MHSRIRLIPSVFGVREDWIREWIEACGESWEGYESTQSLFSNLVRKKKDILAEEIWSEINSKQINSESAALSAS